MSERRTIVVSGVNLRKGGTLTILRQCLDYLSKNASADHRIVALVHRRDLCDYPGIEYIEMPWCIRSWIHRLWAEYVTMHRISREIAAQDGKKVWLWLSMHDTTPRVEAEHQEVYCHTSFPFLKLRLRDWVMDPKIPLFACFTRWAYRINVHRNDNLIVQQNWFADALSRKVGFPREKIRVIRPVSAVPPEVEGTVPETSVPTFFFASTADCHKNFEILCEAAILLQKEVGEGVFKVKLTVRGDENRYARWLFRKWGDVSSIDFHGFESREDLWRSYMSAFCFVFPSRVETWGLPISEYSAAHPDGVMLLADLPYAHETSSGASDVSFFSPDDAFSLKTLMSEALAKYSRK